MQEGTPILSQLNSGKDEMNKSQSSIKTNVSQTAQRKKEVNWSEGPARETETIKSGGG